MERNCELVMCVRAKKTSILQFSTMTKFAEAAIVAELYKISSEKEAFNHSFGAYFLHCFP